MPDYVLVSGSLNRPNLYFSLDSSTSISSVFHLLAFMLSSVKYSKDIPKTLIFADQRMFCIKCIFILCTAAVV